MIKWLSAEQIANLALPELPSSKRAVTRLATREGWASATDRAGHPLARRRDGVGGGWEYHVSLFPHSAKLKLAADALKLEEKANSAAPYQAQPEGLTTKDALRRDAKIAIVQLTRAHALRAGLAQSIADNLFSTLYNAQDIEADAWIYAAIQKVSSSSIARWRKTLNEGNLHDLAGQYTNTRKSALDRAENGKIADYIGALIFKQPHLTAGHIRDLVRAKFGDQFKADDKTINLPPIRTFQRFITTWRKENATSLKKLTDPDGFKSTHRLSGTNMNAHVMRLNQLWEIDASPADVLCNDGRQNLYVVIDIYSRRMMASVSKTPRTQASLLLIRRAIMAWGVPEELRTDNGADFVSYQFKRAMNSLSIEQDVTAPFSPEQKGTVERAIGTLQRGFMPLLPGFIGHSVADRKQIEARKAFSARLGEKDDKAFCVDLSAEELQDKLNIWCADKYGHNQHRGINKETPFQRAAAYTGTIRRIENERALDLLLSPIAGKNGTRKATKYGIKFDGAHFISELLMPGQNVFIRLDPADMGRVYCFESEVGKFICEAICPDRLGVDPAAAVALARRRQSAHVKEQTAAIRREARNIKPRDMIDDVLRQSAEEAGVLTQFPTPSDPHATPSLEEAAIALSEERMRSELTPEQQAAHDKLKSELQVEDNGNVHELPETPKQRFKRAFYIKQAIDAGEDVDPDDARWFGGYEGTSEYRSHLKNFEDFGLVWLEA